jgi:hypothetical protein
MKLTSVDELHRLESEIASEASEAFYHIGQKLLRIKTDRLYQSAGFKSWAQYCASGRIEYGTAQADKYIRASQLRERIPTPSQGGDWNVKSVLELCKCETDNDAKRVVKKASCNTGKTRILYRPSKERK